MSFQCPIGPPPRLNHSDPRFEDWMQQFWSWIMTVWFPKQRALGTGLTYDALDQPEVDATVVSMVPTGTGFPHVTAGVMDGATKLVDTADINADQVTFAKIQNIATDSLVGRDTAGTGDAENILLNSTLSMDGSGNLQRAALSGDVSASAGSNTTAIGNNKVTDAMIRDSAALSVIGRSANSSGDPADIAAGTDGHVLRRSGTTLGFGQIVAAGITDGTITHAKLAVASGPSVLGRATDAANQNVGDITCSATSKNVLREDGAGELGFGKIDVSMIDASGVTDGKVIKASSGVAVWATP